MELAYRLAVDEAPYIKAIRAERHHDDHARRRGGRPRPPGGHLQLAPRAPEGELAAAGLLGQVPRPRQQPRRDGRHARPHQERHRLLRRSEGAAAARPPRVGAVPVRQHRRRRPVQRVGGSDPRRRVAAPRLEQHVGDDQVRHAGRVRPRAVRHLVARLPDVHRRDAQRHQPPVRDVRQRRRRHRGAHAAARPTTRGPGTGRTRRCRRRCGRSATTTTTR